MIPNLSILADQNPDKNHLEKDKELDKRKHRNRREKNKKEKTFEIPVIVFKAEIAEKLPEKSNYSQVTGYNCNKKGYYAKNHLRPKN